MHCAESRNVTSTIPNRPVSEWKGALLPFLGSLGTRGVLAPKSLLHLRWVWIAIAGVLACPLPVSLFSCLLFFFFFFFLFIKVPGNCSNKTPPTPIPSQSHPTLWHHAPGIQCEPPWLRAETLAFWAMRHPEGAAFDSCRVIRSLSSASQPSPILKNDTLWQAFNCAAAPPPTIDRPVRSCDRQRPGFGCIAPETPEHPRAAKERLAQQVPVHLKPRHDPPPGPGWQPPVSGCVVASSTSTLSVGCDNSVGSGIPTDGAGTRRSRHGQNPRGGDCLAGASCASASPWARGHWLGQEALTASQDTILWIHIFLQMLAFGILFPLGMVLGVSTAGAGNSTTSTDRLRPDHQKPVARPAADLHHRTRPPRLRPRPPAQRQAVQRE